MARPTDEVSGRAPRKRKRRDIAQTRHLRRRLNNYDSDRGDPETLLMLMRKGGNRLENIIERSQNRGTFNKKDERAADRLVRDLRKFRLSSDEAGGPLESAVVAKRLHKVARGIKRTYDPPFKGYGSHPTNPDGRDGRKGGGRKHRRKPDHNRGGRGRNRRRGRRGGRDNISYSNAYYSPSYNIEGRAGRLVDADLKQQLRAYLNAIKGIRRQRRDSVGNARVAGKRQRQDLRYLFGEVGDYMGAQNRKVNETFDADKEALGEIYSRGVGASRAAAEGTETGIEEELARLGISGRGSEGTFDADMARNLDMLQGNAADAQANLISQRNSTRDIQSLLGSAWRGERASQIGESFNTQQDTVNDLQDLFRNEIMGLQDEARGLRNSRGAAIRELILALEDQDYGRWAETQQMNFQNQMAVNNFNLSKNQMGWERQAQMAEIARRLSEERARRNYMLSRAGRSAGEALDKIVGGLFG